MKRIIPLLLLTLFTFSFNNIKSSHKNEGQNTLQIKHYRSKHLMEKSPTDKQSQISTFLTFQKGDAEEAMNFYIGLFDNSKIIKLQRWGKEGPGKEGTIMHAAFSLNGQLFMCSDSPPIHEWDFTPAVSNYVECEDESELERLFTKLSENGEVAMPLNNYGFSQKFGWVIDQFGVSWQLNLQ